MTETPKILNSHPLTEMMLLLRFPLIIGTGDTSFAARVIERQIKLKQSIQHSSY